jgi:hypothetical protein
MNMPDFFGSCGLMSGVAAAVLQGIVGLNHAGGMDISIM